MKIKKNDGDRQALDAGLKRKMERDAFYKQYNSVMKAARQYLEDPSSNILLPKHVVNEKQNTQVEEDEYEVAIAIDCARSMGKFVRVNKDATKLENLSEEFPVEGVAKEDKYVLLRNISFTDAPSENAQLTMSFSAGNPGKSVPDKVVNAYKSNVRKLIDYCKGGEMPKISKFDKREDSGSVDRYLL